MSKSVNERIAQTEVRVEDLSARVTSMETACVTKHLRVDEADERLRQKIDAVVKNELHDLQNQINKKAQGKLSAGDWVKIIVAIIVTSGTIIVAALQLLK